MYPSRKESASFSAETYLRNATGPFAPRFRALVPDPYGLDRLDAAKLKASWEDELSRFEEHYGFDEGQKKNTREGLSQTEAEADAWFRDPDTVRRIRKYREDLDRLHALEQAPPSLSFERERADEARKEVEANRREFAAKVDTWTGNLRDAWDKKVTTAQRQHALPMMTRPWTSLDTINALTKYGLMAVGVCLMLGLLTPLAALGAAGYLLMFYLSMPPWPGLPESPMVEGHYLYVNKNLIEMLACLVLASTPNGLWLGLDALLFGWIGRERHAEAEGDPLARLTESLRSH